MTLLWAGKLIRWKGLDLALAAVAKLGATSQVRLRVAGAGPLKEDYESTVERLGLQNVVTFRGAVPWTEMSKEFLEADAFLFTSLRDSFGSVLLEAAAHSLPLIILDIGGPGTFLPESAAFKITPSNVENTVSALTKAILQLRDDPELRKKMGLAARGFAESLAWEKHAAAMWKIYQEAFNPCTSDLQIAPWSKSIERGGFDR